MIWRTRAKFQALFHLVTCSNYSIINDVKFAVIRFLENVNNKELKKVNINYEKLADLIVLLFH